MAITRQDVEAAMAAMGPNPNVRPSIPYSERMTAPLFEPKESLIDRLARIAAPKKEQPTAGAVGIERAREPTGEVPPECMLYEQDHIKFQLGKTLKYRDYSSSSDAAAASKTAGEKFVKTGLEAGIEAMTVSAFKEAQDLAADQKRVSEVPKVVAQKKEVKSVEKVAKDLLKQKSSK